MDRFIPLTILIALRFSLAGMWWTEFLSALLLPDRDNKRFHLSKELQKLACSKASLSPVQSVSPLPPLLAVEALTSVTAWAGRKLTFSSLLCCWGCCCPLVSVARGPQGRHCRGSAFSRSSPGVGLDFSSGAGSARSCCRLAVLLSCPKQVLPGAHWPSHGCARLERSQERREALLSCSASGAWAGLQRAVPHTGPWWASLRQCNMALGFTWCGGLLGRPEGHRWSQTSVQAK